MTRGAKFTSASIVNIVLSGLKNCIAYLVDLAVYTDSWKEHVQILEQVFSQTPDTCLNQAKCDFDQATVTYLGRQMGEGQVRPVEAMVSAISQISSLLTTDGYYCNFCRNFSSVVYPLTCLLSPKLEFVWTPECQHTLKYLSSQAPVLSAPDFTKPFKVDASTVGAGAVLQEDSEGVNNLVSYFSKKFNVCQTKYSTIEKGTLALLLALQYFEVYAGSSPLPLVVHTDNDPLFLLSRTTTTSTLCGGR